MDLKCQVLALTSVKLIKKYLKILIKEPHFSLFE